MAAVADCRPSSAVRRDRCRTQDAIGNTDHPLRFGIGEGGIQQQRQSLVEHLLRTGKYRVVDPVPRRGHRATGADTLRVAGSDRRVQPTRRQFHHVAVDYVAALRRRMQHFPVTSHLVVPRGQCSPAFQQLRQAPQLNPPEGGADAGGAQVRPRMGNRGFLGFHHHHLRCPSRLRY